VLGSREPPGHDPGPELAPRALTRSEQRMVETFHRFACVAPTQWSR